VLVELNLHIYFCVFLNWLFGMELHIACFADGESNRGELHDSEIALWHGHQNVSPFFAATLFDAGQAARIERNLACA
jgi:hypothetical protein